MRTPILQLRQAPTEFDNPNYKQCVWLDISSFPYKIKSYNVDSESWESISSDGTLVNINPVALNPELQLWQGTKSQFDALDSLEDNVYYLVENVGSFVGYRPIGRLIENCLFVNVNSTAKHEIGSSWSYPFKSIGMAIEAAVDGTIICVANGTYKETANSDNCISINKKIKLYGGFDGTEVCLSERKVTLRPTLDGDSSRRIIQNASDEVVIDGFLFHNGFTSGKGGAILSTRTCEVINCGFLNNTSTYGGAVSGVTIVNGCLFNKNKATINGNSIHCTRTSQVIASTIVNGIGANSIYSDTGVNIQLYNTVTWTPSVGGDGIVVGSSSIIEGCASTVVLAGNNTLIEYDNDGTDATKNFVRFVSPSGENYQLSKKSDIIDKGKLEFNTLSLDFAGNSRVLGETIDPGCYEFQNKDNVRSVNGQTGDVIISIDDIEGLSDVKVKLDGHVTDVDNPHLVTADQIGLGQVDNTSDIDKPISIETNQALDTKVNIKSVLDLGEISYLKSKELLVTLKEIISNPTYNGGVQLFTINDIENSLNVLYTEFEIIRTKVDAKTSTESDKNRLLVITSLYTSIGLSASNLFIRIHTADSIPDIIGLTESLSAINTTISTLSTKTELTTHVEDKTNPHAVTKTQVGLGNVDNTADIDKPISTIQKEYVDGEIAAVGVEIGLVNTNLQSHKSDVENPHNVTKTQIGLGNVDNTSDLNKPISTAVGLEVTRINTELSVRPVLESDGKLSIDVMPEALLGAVRYQGIWDAENNDPYLVNGESTKHGYYYIAVNSGIQFGFEFQAGDWVINTNGNWKKVTNTSAVVSVNGKRGVVIVGIDDIANLRDGLNSLATNDALENHILDAANPHDVTKSQVGLGNVDNTADINKPISTPQKLYIDSEINTIDGHITQVSNTLQNHTSNTSNPHTVTKDQLGLGNVDNTSDSNKPVSIAQEARVKLVEDKLQFKADLVNDTVPLSQMDPRMIARFNYNGFWDASTNTPDLQNGITANEGKVYVVQAGGSRFGYTFKSGDLIINFNGTWFRVDNQESIGGVKVVNSYTNLPSTGTEGILYLVVETGYLYFWTQGVYKAITKELSPIDDKTYVIVNNGIEELNLEVELVVVKI